MRGDDARDPCERVPKEAEGIHENVISRRDRRMGMNLEVKKYGTFGSEE